MNRYDSITGGGANGGKDVPGDTSLSLVLPVSCFLLHGCGRDQLSSAMSFATFLPRWEPKSTEASQSQTETRKQRRSSLRCLAAVKSWLTKYQFGITHFSPVTMQGPPLPKRPIASLLLKPCAGGLKCSTVVEHLPSKWAPIMKRGKKNKACMWSGTTRKDHHQMLSYF